jgi:hypothetical protein
MLLNADGHSSVLNFLRLLFARPFRGGALLGVPPGYSPMASPRGSLHEWPLVPPHREAVARPDQTR